MIIPAEYQQAHTTLGCAKSSFNPYASPWCTEHRTHWTLDGCPVAVRVAREVGADALTKAADRLSADTEGEDRVGTIGWPPLEREAYSLAIEEAEKAIRARAEQLRKGEGDE